MDQQLPCSSPCRLWGSSHRGNFLRGFYLRSHFSNSQELFLRCQKRVNLLSFEPKLFPVRIKKAFKTALKSRKKCPKNRQNIPQTRKFTVYHTPLPLWICFSQIWFFMALFNRIYCFKFCMFGDFIWILSTESLQMVQRIPCNYAISHACSNQTLFSAVERHCQDSGQFFQWAPCHKVFKFTALFRCPKFSRWSMKSL